MESGCLEAVVELLGIVADGSKVLGGDLVVRGPATAAAPALRRQLIQSHAGRIGACAGPFLVERHLDSPLLVVRGYGTGGWWRLVIPLTGSVNARRVWACRSGAVLRTGRPELDRAPQTVAVAGGAPGVASALERAAALRVRRDARSLCPQDFLPV